MNIDKNVIVNQLNIARKFYYDGRPIMTDGEFDKLEATLREIDPSHSYFSTVGAAVRGTKIKHKIPMGSLDQATEDEELTKWRHTGEGDIIASDKLDGNSIALYYDSNGDFESAVTRGDGVEGLDVTRHFRRMQNGSLPPIPYNVGREMTVRCEVIMDRKVFVDMVKGYKNPRNYVAGQLNRTIADEVFIERVSVIAFDSDIIGNKTHILDTLSDCGFQVVNYYSIGINSINQDDLTKLLTNSKKRSPYELDGIVLDFNNLSIREALGFESMNPRYAVKFKINQDFVDTEVIDVVWSPSKDGYLKPRVQIEPVDLAGVTISFATGFNAKFILENKVGPGAEVRITRSGDVIPFIQEVIKSADEIAMPTEDKWGGFYWSETGVDLILENKPDESHIKEMVDFFTSIDAPMLKIGNMTMLFDAGYNDIQSIIKASEEDLVTVLGENGTKAFNGLRDKLTEIDEYVLAGSLPFFGRGVGKRKMKVLAELHGDIGTLGYDAILDTPGFDETTAVKVSNAIPLYNEFIKDMSGFIGIKKYVKIEGDLNMVAVCFTGVRDKNLEGIIESRGGKVLSSPSKQMTHLVAKDPAGKSGKLDKARKAGAIIWSLDQAKENWIEN